MTEELEQLLKNLKLRRMREPQTNSRVCGAGVHHQGGKDLADRSSRQLLKRLARLDVLLIDEFGYLNLKPEQSNIFFKLMEERYRQHSTIITTNLDNADRPNFFHNPPMEKPLQTRLRHHPHPPHTNAPPLPPP